MSYDDFGYWRTRASVGIPLIDDSLGISVSGFLNHGDNYIDGRVGSQPLPHDVDKGGRVRVRWKPAEALDITFGASTTASTGLRSTQPVNTTPSLLGRLLLIQPQDPYAWNLTEAPNIGYRETVYNAQAVLDTDWFDVKLLGGKQSSTAVQGLDFAGAQNAVAYFVVDPNIVEAKSAELQIVSNETSWESERLKWIIGAYYFKQHGGYKDGYLRVAATDIKAGAAQIFGNQLPENLQSLLDIFENAPLPNGLVGFNGLLDTDSKSTYAQASYDFTDWVTLMLGGRYQVEKREIDSSQTFLRLQDGGKILLPGFGPTLQEDYSCATDSQWCATAKAFSPKVGLNFRLSDDALLYASWQQATKSGTFNTINIYDRPEYVKPEDIDAYEVGLKTSLFDRSVQFNLAGFYYELRNLQTQFVSLLAGGAISFENAPAAEVKGIEFDLIASVASQAIDDLVFIANGAYLDAKYTDFPEGSGFNPATGIYTQSNDYSGNRIVRSPKFSGSVGLNKNFSLPFGGVEVGTMYYYNSGYYFLAENLPEDYENAFGLLSAHVTLEIDAWDLSVSAFGENITSAEHNITRFAADFGTLDSRALKSVYGIRFNWTLK